MKTRERWIVGLMACVVAYGVYTFAVGLRDQTGVARKAADEREGTCAFVVATRNRLNRFQLAPESLFVLQKTVDDWAASPFYEQPPREQPAKVQPESVIFTGFLQVGDTRIAILNGREYRIAETVNATDFVIDSIEADRVVLVSRGGGRRITLALTGNNGETP